MSETPYTDSSSASHKLPEEDFTHHQTADLLDSLSMNKMYIDNPKRKTGICHIWFDVEKVRNELMKKYFLSKNSYSFRV